MFGSNVIHNLMFYCQISDTKTKEEDKDLNQITEEAEKAQTEQGEVNRTEVCAQTSATWL